MLFNSFEFAIFFPVVTLLYFLLPHRFRWSLLLAASCFFYMFFKAIYILILIFTILIDYFAGILMARQSDRKKRKRILLLSILANVGVLVVFKYYNFVAENLQIALNSMHSTGHIPMLNLLLPIGLSFHTFQAMSYTIEVFRGKQQPEKHLGIYSLYVMFYPQLVAGPIERPQNLLHQFHEPKKFNYDDMRVGLVMMAWGLFKKVVIADRLALFVNHVYGDPSKYHGLPLIISTVFFAFQIYCDFSGYSDIAIGSARCMGFRLMKNFNHPYQSRSVAGFWQRWHISLSTWFRDYLYIPLGGNRVGPARWSFNILVVFLLSGAWHGANWTFVIWGILHGCFMIIERFGRKLYRLPAENTSPAFFDFLHRSKVFVLVTLAWVFFRAENLQQAIYVLRNMFVGVPTQLKQLLHGRDFSRLKLLYLDQSFGEFMIAVLGIILLLGIEFRQKNMDFGQWLTAKPTAIRWAGYYIIILSFVTLGIFNRSEFIYFQF